MASVNLTGTLTNPEGEPDEGAIVKFTLLTTTGTTVSSSKSQLEVPQDGLYDIDIVYGNLRVDYINEDGTTRFVAIVTVNGDTVATSLPELLNAAVPPTDAQLLEFQGILADAVTAQVAAEAAETGAVAAEATLLAEKLTTVQLIALSNTFAVGSVIDTLGYTSNGDGGGAQWVKSGISGSTPSQSPAQKGGAVLSDGTGDVWALAPSSTINVKSLGAIGDGVSNDTLAIQAAINSTGSHITYLPSGTYSVRNSGTMNARGYALLLPSGANLVGAGVSLTTISAFNDTTIYEVITDDRNNPTTDIKIDGLTIFGDHDNRPKGGMGLWLQFTTNITIGDLFIDSMTGFGIRMNKCSEIFWDSIKVKSTFVQPNDDGIHFYDCFDIVGNKAIIETAGDDCFIITAELTDVANISVNQIVVSSPTGNRGVLLNLGDAANAMHTISNIKLGVVANDCLGPAALLSQAAFRNINIEVISSGCKNALRFDMGDIGFGKGSVKNCSFNVQSYNDIEEGVFGTDGSTIDGNMLDAMIYNNGDAFSSVALAGSDWHGSLKVNQDPNGVRVTPMPCFDVYTTDSSFSFSGVNANTGISLRSTAQDNTFNIGTIKNNVSHSVDNFSGASANRFIGGVVDSTVNIPANNEFFGTKGADNKGVSGTAISGSGIITIPHGLVQAPTNVLVTYSGSNSYTARHSNMDATNLYVGLFDAAGAPITAGIHFIYWQASL
jgi:hypothetical protein